MIIRVAKRNHPYVQIDKTALEDSRLSFRAKGLHAYLLSRPDEWNPNREHLATVSTEGRDAVAKALKELELAGYLIRRRYRDKETNRFKWVGTVYEVSQTPLTGKPPMGNQATDSPPTENPPVISNRVTRTENNKTPSADKPREASKGKRYPAEWYAQLVEAYQEIKGIQLNGPELDPIRRDLKLIFRAGHTPEDVQGCMEAFAASDQDWTAVWTIKTIRAKLAEWKAGKLALSGPPRKGRFQAATGSGEDYSAFVKNG